MLPFDVDEVRIDVGKHFRNTWMRRWRWDQLDLREALREAYTVTRAGKRKWEVFVRKQGAKKLIIAYGEESHEVFVITGAEG
ncbi:MAG: hypothetical protein A3K65_09195 [Euryarchaeota archaeon RBG_16_68_12]|nr:MAG: hypothetical protein A3K65_09195 [Euryarchaeota archaeon RBG_16_68_12]